MPTPPGDPRQSDVWIREPSYILTVIQQEWSPGASCLVPFRYGMHHHLQHPSLLLKCPSHNTCHAPLLGFMRVTELLLGPGQLAAHPKRLCQLCSISCPSPG